MLWLSLLHSIMDTTLIYVYYNVLVRTGHKMEASTNLDTLYKTISTTYLKADLKTNMSTACTAVDTNIIE